MDLKLCREQELTVVCSRIDGTFSRNQEKHSFCHLQYDNVLLDNSQTNTAF